MTTHQKNGGYQMEGLLNTGKTDLHTEFFYAGNRSCFIDLKNADNNKLYIQIAIGTDKGDYTTYKRIALFEHELLLFAEALCGVLREYVNISENKPGYRSP